MNIEQYLLTKLAEEASEISQIALKAQQFGMSEVMAGQPLTNAERIYAELNDLVAILEMLDCNSPFRFVPSSEAIAQKKSKVLKYAKYTHELGILDSPCISV